MENNKSMRVFPMLLTKKKNYFYNISILHNKYRHSPAIATSTKTTVPFMVQYKYESAR